MDFGTWIIWVMFIIFGSLSAPFSIWQIGRILRERRQDRIAEMQLRNQQQLEEMKIKAEMDSKILGGGTAVTENLTCELQALREEIRQMKDELNRLKTGSDTNYIR